MGARAVIAGIGQTAFGKLPGRSTISLNMEACRKAVADAGIGKDAVDGLLVKVPTSRVEMMYGQTLAEAMGRAMIDWLRDGDSREPACVFPEGVHMRMWPREKKGGEAGDAAELGRQAAPAMA